MSELATTTTIAPTGFDYSALDAASAEKARSTAARIRSRSMHTIVETGRDLITIKAMLDHGAFGRWLDAEFGWTDRTAQNYMGAAGLAESKSEIVSLLPATTLYRLASPSTPDAIRDEIIARFEAGETISTKEISSQIAGARKQQAEAQRLARIPPEKLKRIKRSKEQREREHEQETLKWRKREQEERDAARQAVAFLRDRLPGDQFRHFVVLIERAGSSRFRTEIEKDLEARP
jgi:hypothetical protein